MNGLEQISSLLQSKNFYNCLLVSPVLNERSYNFWTSSGDKICSIFAKKAKFVNKNDVCDLYVVSSLVPKRSILSHRYSETFFVLSITGFRLKPTNNGETLSLEVDHLWFKRGMEEASVLIPLSLIPAAIYNSETECHYNYKETKQISDFIRTFHLNQPEVIAEGKDTYHHLLKLSEETEVSKLFKLLTEKNEKKVVLPIPQHILLSSEEGKMSTVFISKGIAPHVENAIKKLLPVGGVKKTAEGYHLKLKDIFRLSSLSVKRNVSNLVFMSDMHYGAVKTKTKWSLDFSQEALNNMLLLSEDVCKKHNSKAESSTAELSTSLNG